MFKRTIFTFTAMMAMMLLLPFGSQAVPIPDKPSGKGTLTVDPVVIGTGTEMTMNAPVTPWYGYSFTQTLYFQSEINVSQKVINKIGYQYAGSDSGLELEIEIWISHTSLNTLTNTVPLTGHQKVYDGSWTLHAGDEYSIIETLSFYYNNTDNLIITVIEKKPGYSASSDQFYSTPVDEGQILCVGAWNDSSPYSSGNLPSSNQISVRANTKLWFDEMPTGPAISVITPSHLDFGDVEIGTTVSLPVLLKNAGVDMLVITGFQSSNPAFEVSGVTFPIQLGMLETKTVNVGFSPTNSSLQSGTMTFLFDAGIQGDRNITMSGRGSNLVSVVVGDGTEPNSLVPFSPYYGYSFTQTIYLQSEINIADRMIRRIGYHYAGPSTDLGVILEIYLKHTELTELPTTQQLAGHTKVFDGPVTFSQNTDFTWIPVEGFYYNNTDNLMVTVIEKKPGYNSSEDQFYATDHNGEAVRCRWARNDSNPYDSGNLPTGSDSYNLPNTKFWLADLPTEPIISLNPASLDYGQVEATVEKTLVVTAKNNGGGTLVINDIVFSNDVFSVKNATFPISLSIGQSYDFQFSFIPDEIQLEEGTATFVVDESVPGNKVVQLSGRGLRFGVLRESFEGTLFPPLGWTVVDYNNDGKGWLRNTTNAPTGQTVPHTGIAAAGLDVYAGSPNQISYNDWLITPEMIWQDGDLFSFWIKRLANQQGQKWRIAYSTGGNDPSNFTVIDEIVDPSMSYTEKSYDMSQYGLMNGETYYMAFQFYSQWCWPGVIDDVMGSVLNRLQHDLMITDASTTNEYLYPGVASNFDVKVANYGLSSVIGSDYKVQIATYLNGAETILAEIDGADISQGEIATFNVPLVMQQVGLYSVYAKIEWPADENEVNNLSNLFTIEVLNPSVVIKHIGTYPLVPNAKYYNLYPIDFEEDRKSSLTQTLYFKNELNTGGIMDRIVYYYTLSQAMNQRKIKIWVTETDINSLDAYIPASDMTLVFDGKIDCPEGKDKITIPFTKPYVYTGGRNLAVTVYYYGGTSKADVARFAYMEPDYGPTRVMADGGWGTIDPENMVFPYTYPNYNITSFAFNTGEGLGNINGWALYQSDNTPVVGATVEVTNPAFPGKVARTTTDASGFYEFPYALAGNGLTITISKYGYSDVVFENKQLNPGGNLNLGNAYMVVRPLIALSGSVIKSDSQGPAQSASVKITGIDTYETTTNGNGQFSFASVWGSTNYTIEINLQGYQPYKATITVPGINYVIPQITLLENAPAPNVVTATASGNNALVKWFAAGQAYPQIFRYDDGEAVGVLITPGSPSITGGSVWKYDAIVQSVQWYTYNSDYPKSDNININILGINADGSPNPNNVLATFPNITNNYGWNSYTLPQAVNAPNGFFFGISGNNNYTLLAYDDGEGEPYEWEPRRQWSNGLGSYNPLENATSPPLFGNIFIRAAGFTNGPIENQEAQASYLVNLETSDSQLITQTISPFQTGEPEVMISPIENRSAKSFESYSVYRRKSTETNWIKLNAQPVSDTAFLDTNFGALGYGAYQFGVEANYTNGVTSKRSVSNLLEKDMRLALTLQVETNTGVAGISAGASVKLVNNSGNANHVYNATVGTNGSVVINNVYKGIYTLTINHIGFHTYLNDAVNLEVEGITQQMSVSLTERTDDPFDVEVVTEGFTSGKARLLWNQEPVFDNVDGYTAFATTNVGTWKLVDQDGQPTVYPAGVNYPGIGQPMAFMVMNRAQTTPPLSQAYWAAHSGEQYFAGFGSATGSTNNWLISELQQHSLDYTLSFWAKSVTDNYGLETFRIGYSTASNSISDFVFITGNETVPMFWTKFSYTIPADAKYVAIRHNHTGLALLIDDISIGVVSDGAIPGNGFTVYLDGEEMANGLDDNQFDFNNLLPGSHVAGVKANYYTATSNTIEIPFELPQGTPVTFTVNTNTGQAVNGAFVEITQQGQSVANGYTQNGTFQTELYPGAYHYQVNYTGYTAVTGNITVGNVPLNVPVVLASTVDVVFVVKNSAGQAIQGATVVLNGVHQQTPANGTVSFNIQAGTANWAVTHPNYQRKLGSQQINANTTLQITMQNLECEAPQNLQANATQNNVALTWTAPAVGSSGNWIHWDGAHNNNSIGTGGAVDFDVAQRFTPADLTAHNGKFLTRVMFVPREANCTYSVRVWTGGNISGPANMVVDQVVTNPVMSAWNEILLDIPVYIDATKELWIGFRNNTTTGHPAGTDAGPAIDGKGNMINLAGQGWQTLLQVAPTLNYNWSVRGLVESTGTRGNQLIPISDEPFRKSATSHLVAVQHEDMAVEGNPRVLLGYNIYRNGNKLNTNPVAPVSYSDNNVAIGTHSYHVTSVWSNGCESQPSNTVQVTITQIDCPAPENLEAWVDDNNPNKINLAWNQEPSVEFRYDDGVRTGQLGFQSGTLNGVLGAAHPQAATLDQMSWLLSDDPDGGGPHATVQLYVLGLTAAGMPNGTDVLYSGSVTNTDGTWNTFTFPQPISAPNGFFLGVAYNGFVGLGIDDGTGAPYVYQPNTHYYSSNYTGNAWTKWEASGFSQNGMIRAQGVAGAKISVAPEATTYFPDETPVLIPAASPVQTGSPEWDSRGTLLGYNIYHQGQLLQSLWNGTEYSYTEMQINLHCYKVTAVYQECGESDPSNEACVDVVVGLFDQNVSPASKVYPIPANEILNIEGSKLIKVELTNASGQLIISRIINSQDKVQLNLNGVKAGLYVLHIHTTNAVETRKVVIE